MIIETNVFIVASEKPNIKNVTFLQLITLFSNSLSNCSLSKVFNSNEDLQINDSSIKPCSIPTWYIDKIVDSYLKLNVIIHSSLGAIGWLSKTFEWALLNTINQISIMGILRYFYILLIYLIPILYFINIKKNKLNKYINIKNIIVVSLLFSIPVYLLVLDWGRVTYLNYNFLMISVIFLFNNNLVDNTNIDIKLKKLSITKKIIIFFVIDLMWGPKLMLTDELGKIPLYKSFTKFLKFI